MITIPPIPPARGEDVVGEAELLPRYEDIAQDGRFLLPAMTPGLGAAVWRALLRKIPASKSFQEQGILPILSRMVLVGEDRSVSVHSPVRYQGRFRFARQRGGDRLFVNMWVDAFAPVASTFGPAPAKDAEAPLVGRIFAEHVITRPFAGPGERKVTRLDAPGVAPVPEDEHDFEDAEALATQVTNEDAPTEVRFGMMHTDSNQHVNSLVYPRIAEEHAVHRLPDGARGKLLARALDMRWRKPFFAGERARLTIGARDGESVALFRPAETERPSCAIAIRLG